jgi:predicted MFS family arabinose efflux permease
MPDNAAMDIQSTAAPPAKSMAPDDMAAVPIAAIAALSFAAFASAASLRVTDPSLTRIAEEYGVTIAIGSYAITAFSLAYGVLQIVFGPAGDRFGKVRVVAWACAASTATALACAVAPTFIMLLAARALSGAAAAAIIPLSMAWIGDVVPYHRRQPVLARFLTGQIMGVASGGLLGGFAADHFGWRAAFVFIAAWFAVACLLLLRLRRSLPAPVLVRPQEGQSALAHMVGSMREVVGHPWPRVILTVVLLEGVTLFGAFAFVATHVHLLYGLSLTLAGSVTLMFGFGGLSFAFASRWLVRRMGEAGMAACGAMLLGASVMTVGLIHLQWLAMPCMFTAGLGFYMLHNTLQTQATQMAPTRRGAAVSLFAFCYFVGQSVGVALAGCLLRYCDTGTVIGLGGAAVMVVGLRFAQLRSRMRASV